MTIRPQQCSAPYYHPAYCNCPKPDNPRDPSTPSDALPVDATIDLDPLQLICSQICELGAALERLNIDDSRLLLAAQKWFSTHPQARRHHFTLLAMAAEVIDRRSP